MDSVYIIFIVILFILAISDLVVGVANDAVNFLNSAVGSKATSFKLILVVASIGLLVGSTFSSGLMEIARKGLFFPGMFSFEEVIFIFLAVMITDVILLDLYNTFGLPTSTTVSIVFELLGASVAIAIINISGSEQTIQDLGQYINAAKALAIITAILVSVALAFSLGTFVQYISRVIFTFNIRYNLKYFAAIWGGLSITGIIYFIVIKGAKGASFINENILNYFDTHSGAILLISFLGLSLLFQFLMMAFKLNVLKLIVLSGTFALALAFAGNDMVNFIGVPLAGLKAFQLFNAVPGADPQTFLMTGLANDVKTETWMLLIAGVVMIITLWTSKKARTVIDTEVDLGRQQEGNERFNSSILSRNLVRGARNLTSAISAIIPVRVSLWLEKRFEAPDIETRKQMPEGASFDLLRASVNLVVASVLIALGTSLKLPLSTTYVTFMVAMGTSLSDRAWGRESAVYRITGVLSIIGGWFFTALGAFTIAFLAAIIIYYGGLIATIVLLIIVGFLIYRSNIIHVRRANERQVITEMELTPAKIKSESFYRNYIDSIQQVLQQSLGIFNESVVGLFDEDRKMLKNAKNNALNLNTYTKQMKNNVSSNLFNMKEPLLDSAPYYVQVIDYVRELNHSISYIITPCLEHIDNNHKPLVPRQIEEMSRLNVEISLLFDKSIKVLISNDIYDVDEIFNRQQIILQMIEEFRRKQIKRIKQNETGTRNSVLYLNILAETKNLSFYILNIIKANRDFNIVSKKDLE
ncbi:MAG: inorganic phosphate transporter [Lentimicrobium sp.]